MLKQLLLFPPGPANYLPFPHDATTRQCLPTKPPSRTSGRCAQNLLHGTYIANSSVLQVQPDQRLFLNGQARHPSDVASLFIRMKSPSDAHSVAGTAKQDNAIAHMSRNASSSVRSHQIFTAFPYAFSVQRCHPSAEMVPSSPQSSGCLRTHSCTRDLLVLDNLSRPLQHGTPVPSSQSRAPHRFRTLWTAPRQCLCVVAVAVICCFAHHRAPSIDQQPRDVVR